MDYVKNINGYPIKDEEARNEIESLNEDFNAYKNGKSVLQKTTTPVIIGETSDVSQMTAVLKRGNRCYTFSANNYDGMGRVELYNTENNSIIWRKNKLVGHCNSVCFNETDGFIYIVPMNTYTGGTETILRQIYRYSADFEELTPIPISTTNRPYMISYDHVTNKMYCAGYLHTTKQIELFEFVENAFELLKIVDVLPLYRDLNNSATVTMQDFAVNDGIMYISTVNRNVMCFDIETGLPTDSYYVNMYDAMQKYELGELEGFEFGDDGVLYAMNTYYYSADYTTNLNAHNQLGIYRPSCGIVTAINTDKANTTNTLNNFSSFNQCAITASLKDMFYLPMNKVKGLEFISNLKVNITYFSLEDGTYNLPSMYVRKPNLYIHIKSGASLTIGKWWIYSDSIIIRNDGTFACSYRGYYTSAPLDLSLATTRLTLVLPGSNTFPESASNLVETAYTRAFVTTGNIANNETIRVGGNNVSKYSFTINGKTVWVEP